MTEFSQRESSQFTIPELPAKKAAPKKIEAAHGDTVFLLLVALAFIVLLAALAVGLLTILGSIIPQLELQFFQQQTLLSTTNMPFAIQDGYVLLAGLLFLSLAIYMAARWRVMHNRSLWPSAGCPSCHDQTMLRVHRKSGDRAISLIGIAVARYQCRNCRWNGLRIHRGLRPVVHSEGSSNAIAAVHNAATGTAEPAQEPAPKLEVIDLVEDRESSIKWQARLSDPITVAAITEIIEDEAPPLSETTIDGGETPSTTEETVDIEDESVFAIEESDPLIEEPTTNDFFPAFTPFAVDIPGDDGLQETGLTQEHGNIGSAIRAEIAAPFGLNLRQDPQSDGVVVDLLEPGTIVQLLDRVTREDGAAWQQIKVADQHGWVLSSFLKSCE